jgi:hypothetical protein
MNAAEKEAALEEFIENIEVETKEALDAAALDDGEAAGDAVVGEEVEEEQEDEVIVAVGGGVGTGGGGGGGRKIWRGLLYSFFWLRGWKI